MAAACSELASLRSCLEAQSRRLDRLQERQLELEEESEAVRYCLEADKMLSVETFLAQVHRLRFNRARRCHPCTFDASFQASLQTPGLVLGVASFTGFGTTKALGTASTALRQHVQAALPRLSQLFPPPTYAIGGLGVMGDVLSSVERLDLAEGLWTPVAPLDVARWGAAVGALQGRVVVAGGCDAQDNVLSSVETFNPLRGWWEDAPQLDDARMEAACTSSRGSLLVIGGRGDPQERGRGLGPLLGAVEQCAARSDTWELELWTRAPPISVTRRAAAAATLASQVFLLGGFDETNQALREVEVLHLGPRGEVGRSWLPAPPLQRPRGGIAAAVALGCVYAVGGALDMQDDSRAVERFEPGAAAWELLAPLDLPRAASCAVGCAGSILLLGGCFHRPAEAEGAAALMDFGPTLRYDPHAGTWSAVEQPGVQLQRRCCFGAAACREFDSVPGAAGGHEGTNPDCSVS